MGDYHYEYDAPARQNNDDAHVHVQLFSLSICRTAQLPDLFIRREGIFDSVKRAFGFDDIDFESAEFSKRFFVKSSDKRFAYDVIHPKMMEFLLATRTGRSSKSRAAVA